MGRCLEPQRFGDNHVTARPPGTIDANASSSGREGLLLREKPPDRAQVEILSLMGSASSPDALSRTRYWAGLMTNIHARAVPRQHCCSAAHRAPDCSCWLHGFGATG